MELLDVPQMPQHMSLGENPNRNIHLDCHQQVQKVCIVEVVYIYVEISYAKLQLCTKNPGKGRNYPT